MPRFDFDLRRDGVTETDHDGLELPSVHVARAEAARTAVEMVKEGLAADGVGLNIAVRDDRGAALFEVAALVRIEPADRPPGSAT